MISVKNTITPVRFFNLLMILFLGFMPVILLAQTEEEEKESGLSDRLFFGGNFGLMFGTITNIEISPLVGYYITPRLAAGTGIRFEYYRDKGYYAPYHTTIFGGNVFSRYTIIKNLGEGLNIGLNAGYIRTG